MVCQHHNLPPHTRTRGAQCDRLLGVRWCTPLVKSMRDRVAPRFRLGRARRPSCAMPRRTGRRNKKGRSRPCVRSAKNAASKTWRCRPRCGSWVLRVWSVSECWHVARPRKISYLSGAALGLHINKHTRLHLLVQKTWWNLGASQDQWLPPDRRVRRASSGQAGASEPPSAAARSRSREGAGVAALFAGGAPGEAHAPGTFQNRVVAGRSALQYTWA